MKNGIFLFIAIVSETFATSALKSSEGFSRLWPSVLVVIGYKYYVRHGLPPVGSDGKLRA